MGILAPVLNNGQIYGNFVLYRGNSFIDEKDINKPFGIEIQFFSPSDEYVGMVGTTFDKANLIDLSVTVEKYGDLKKAEFSITRLVDIPFYNQMECRAFINGNWWWSWELQLKPNEDRSDPKYSYEGKGWSSYLREIKINKLYQNKTLEYILKDIIENDIEPNTPIEYNPSLIEPPSYTVTKLEIKKKTVEKAIEEVLKIANYDYNTIQFRYGVNKEKQFFFSALDDSIDKAFFEGYDYQEPDLKENLKAVINQINIYRAQEDSQTVEFVSQKENTTSQGLYGIRNKDITISDYVDTTTAERIADAILERFNDPVLEIKIKELKTEDEPYDISFYNINNRKNNYTIIIDEFEDLANWNLNISNTNVTVANDKALSGKKSFKAETTSGSQGEYIELVLEDTFYFPTNLIFYFATDTKGELFKIAVEDEDGNILESDDDYILLENGEKILLENEDKLLLEGDDIEYFRLVEDFQKYELNISALDNVKKIRIYFETNEDITLYFDRLEIFANIYKQNTLSIDKITYNQKGNTLLADVIFGEEIDNIINDIKKLDEKAVNTVNIFQKS